MHILCFILSGEKESKETLVEVGEREKKKEKNKGRKKMSEKVGYTLYFRSNRSLTGSGTSEREFGSTSP